jgi:hypothetical protein
MLHKIKINNIYIMNSNILKNILNDIYKNGEEINRNSNMISELLNIECFNYNITETEIDEIKDIFIDNINLYVDYLQQILFTEINELSSYQLVDILKWNKLSIFTIKYLYNINIQTKLIETEKEMYKYCVDIFNDITLYNKMKFINEFYGNKYTNKFLNEIINKENDIDDIKYNDKDTKYNNNDIKNIIENYNRDNINIIELDELKYTLWNENVLLYEFRNKNTYDYVYIYFDLLSRKNKNETDKIIEMEIEKKYCICMNISDIIEYDMLEKYIDKIIENII